MYVPTDALISVPVLLCFVVTRLTTANVVKEPNSIGSDGFNDAVIKQLWEKRCSRQYNVGCLKMDVVRLMNRLEDNTNLQIFPGISLVKSTSRSLVMPEVIESKPDEFLDNYLLTKFTNYISSLTLNVKVLDPALMNTAKSLGDGFGLISESNSTGTARRKNKFSNSMLTAGLMSGATMLALGMSALAAMAGKALMTSLLALMLSAMGALKGNGDGHKSTTYEIVSRPVVTHAHTHSSEVQHLTGHGGHGSHDSGYGYARSMASTPVHPLINEDTNTQYITDFKKDNMMQMAYQVHELPNLTTYSTTSSTPTSSEASPTYSSQPFKY